MLDFVVSGRAWEPRHHKGLAHPIITAFKGNMPMLFGA